MAYSADLATIEHDPPSWDDILAPHAWQLPEQAACGCPAWEHLSQEHMHFVAHADECADGRRDADALVVNFDHPTPMSRECLAGMLRGVAPDVALDAVRAEREAEAAIAAAAPAALPVPADVVTRQAAQLAAEMEAYAAGAADAEALAAGRAAADAAVPAGPDFDPRDWDRFIGGRETSAAREGLRLQYPHRLDFLTCTCPVWTLDGAPTIQLHSTGCRFSGHAHAFTETGAATLGVEGAALLTPHALAAAVRGIPETEVEAAIAGETEAVPVAWDWEEPVPKGTPLRVPPAPGAVQANAENPALDAAGSAENPGPDAQTAEQTESDAQAAAQAKAEAHMAAADAPELLDAVFCTDLLKEIRTRAKKAQVSPMLALSANIGGLLSVVPYQVCLPKLVGKRRQPLNLITVPVDESGGGKGGATTVDIDPIPAQRGQRFVGLPSDAVAGAEGVEKVRRIPIPVPAGSGEAMAEGYAHMEKCEHTGEKISVNHNESAWFAWDEVGKILAVRDRKGSTIEPELCHGWSWETLGSKTKTNPFWVEPCSYRMLVTICAQLVTAAGLLADEYTGLVQRIFWVSAAYTIDEEDAAPEKLAAGRRDATGDWFAEPDDAQPLIPVQLPEWPSDGVLRVAASVAAEIEAARAAHGRGRKSHPWDRHQLQIRLRLAAAGAIMHGCADVTAEWWAWAGLLIEHSKHVRDAVVALRGTATTKAATDAGKSDAIRAEARSTAQWRRAVDSTEKWAEEQLGSRPDSLGRFTLNQAKRAAGPGFRKDNMGDILAALIQVGKLMPDVVNVPSAGGDVVYYRFLPKKG